MLMFSSSCRCRRGIATCSRRQRFGNECLLPFRWMSLCVPPNKLRDDWRSAMDSWPTFCVTAKRCRKASTREWIVRAKEDFLAATALKRRSKKPLWNIVCFHVQQAVEKYLKARLEEAGLSVPKTHDLLHLLNLALPTEPLWSSYHGAFSLPAGNSVTKNDARHAIWLCREFRKEACRALGWR